MERRNSNFDIVRAVAIFMVICIHSLGLVNDALATGDEEARMTNAAMTIVYGGVPLFVMLSGALLLGKEESIGVFFRKRVGRVLWPFLFWSVIVCAILYWQEGGRSLSGYATSLFTGLVTGGVHGIYWYVYMIIGLYLVTPFLRKIVHHSDNGYLYYLIGLLLSIITASKYFPDVELFSRWNSANVEMLAYFVIGYAIVEYFKTHQISTNGVFGCFTVLYLLHAVSVYFHWSIPLLEMALYISLFCVLMKVRLPVKIQSGGGKISQMSYGIYLSHFMLVSAFLKFGIFQKLPLCIEPLVMAFSVLVATMLMLQVMEIFHIKKFIM